MYVWSRQCAILCCPCICQLVWMFLLPSSGQRGNSCTSNVLMNTDKAGCCTSNTIATTLKMFNQNCSDDILEREPRNQLCKGRRSTLISFISPTGPVSVFVCLKKQPRCRVSDCCSGWEREVYTGEFVWSQLLRWLSLQQSPCSSHWSPPPLPACLPAWLQFGLQWAPGASAA